MDLGLYIQEPFNHGPSDAIEVTITPFVPHLTILLDNSAERIVLWQKDTLTRSFMCLFRSLELDGGRSWRNLRDTYASHLVMAGVPLRGIQQLLGHSTIRMTEKYAWLAQDSLEEAVGRLDFSPTD